MNIHENMLRSIILRTIQGVKASTGAVARGIRGVIGSMASRPPEELYGPHGIKKGFNEDPTSGLPVTPFEASRFGTPPVTSKPKIEDPRGNIVNSNLPKNTTNPTSPPFSYFKRKK